MAMQTPVLRTSALQMTFPNGTHALRGVDLAVEPGERIVIIGRSGAGKSTLLRCLNRLIRPTGGQVLLGGQDVTRVGGSRLRTVRRRVGMIFQQFNLVGRLTVLDNVLAGRLRFHRTPVRWLRSCLHWFGREEQAFGITCLDRLGISGLAFQRADTLSGGQQQRVAIARAMAQDPEVILADEPIASLDPHSARQVMEALVEIQRTRGIPIVVNLHQVDIARAYATRVIGMSFGQVLFDGPPEQLDDSTVERIYQHA